MTYTDKAGSLSAERTRYTHTHNPLAPSKEVELKQKGSHMEACVADCDSVSGPGENVW